MSQRLLVLFMGLVAVPPSFLVACDPLLEVKSHDELLRAWESLASPDSAKAYRAVWSMVQIGNEAVPFLKNRLRAVRTPEPEAIAKLIADLGNDVFAVREKATQEMRRLAEMAEPALRKIKDSNPPLELRTRVDNLLARLEGPSASSEQTQALRALESLELLATNEARGVIEHLAKGAPQARLTQQAQSALLRLSKRRHAAVSTGSLQKHDLTGDELPQGAGVRLGTARFRDIREGVFLPECETLAVRSHGMIRLLRSKDGKELSSYPLNTTKETMTEAFVSEDGRWLAVKLAESRRLSIHELATGKAIYHTRVRNGQLDTFWQATIRALSSDGKLVYATDDCTSFVFDVTTGKRIQRFEHSKKGASDICGFSSDGKYLAVSNGKDPVRVLDVSTGELIHSLVAHDRGVCSAAFSKNGKMFVTGGYCDKSICLWDLHTGKKIQQIMVESDNISALAFSPDQKQIAAVGTRSVWEKNGKEAVYLWNLDPHANALTTIAMPGIRWVRYSPNGALLATGRFWMTVSFLDPKSGKEIMVISNAHTGGVKAIEFSRDGTKLASASEDQTVRLWETASGKLLRTFSGHSDAVRSIAYSSDASRLASSADDGTTRVWDVKSGELKQTFRHRPGIWGVSLSRDWEVFAAVDGRRESIRIWGIADGMLRRTIHPEDEIEIRPVLSENGRWLAEGNRRELRVRDMYTDRIVHRLPIDCERAGVVFAPDNRTIAVATKEKVVLWELLTGGERINFPAKYNGWGCSLEFSSDARLLAFGRREIRDLTIWNLSTAKEMGRFRGHTSGISALAFSPDCRRIATGSEDTSVLIWALSK